MSMKQLFLLSPWQIMIASDSSFGGAEKSMGNGLDLQNVRFPKLANLIYSRIIESVTKLTA